MRNSTSRSTTSRCSSSPGVLVCFSGLQQLLELGFVQNRDAQVPGFLLLGTGVLTDNDVVGLLGHGPRRLTSAREDRLLGAIVGALVR